MYLKKYKITVNELFSNMKFLWIWSSIRFIIHVEKCTHLFNYGLFMCFVTHPHARARTFTISTSKRHKPCTASKRRRRRRHRRKVKRSYPMVCSLAPHRSSHVHTYVHNGQQYQLVCWRISMVSTRTHSAALAKRNAFVLRWANGSGWGLAWLCVQFASVGGGL